MPLFLVVLIADSKNSSDLSGNNIKVLSDLSTSCSLIISVESPLIEITSPASLFCLIFFSHNFDATGLISRLNTVHFFFFAAIIENIPTPANMLVITSPS